MTINSIQSMADGDPSGAARGDAVAGAPRKPWSTPLVMIAAVQGSKAHVQTYTDGTNITGYQYGS